MESEPYETSRELQDWRELFEAVACLPLPEQLRPRALWPNKWHKDCAVVALALHNREDEMDWWAMEKDQTAQLEKLQFALNFLRLPLGIDPAISNLDTEKLLAAFTEAFKQRGILPSDVQPKQP